MIEANTYFQFQKNVSKRKPPPHDDQLELFSAIFTDIASRDVHDTLEYPFLSISTKPRFEPIQYVGSNGVEITVSSGKPFGIATIFDWDLMIWILSQIRQAYDMGIPVSRKVRFGRADYLKDVRRGTSGREYKQLAKTIGRLRSTMVTTNLRATERDTVMFSWFEYTEYEKDSRGRLSYATVVLPEWLFTAVCDHRLVLNLHRDYFLLTSGLERCLYRVARKGAGKTSWKWKLATIHERSGSTREFKDFAKDVRKIIRKGPILDYQFSISKNNGDEYVRAKQLKAQIASAEPSRPPIQKSVQFLRLETETYRITKAMIPGHDVYAVEQIWLRFNEKTGADIIHADKAFLAFCKTYAEKNPIPGR